MPKAKAAKRNGSASSSPYTAASKNHIFKMNTDLGQHILKNPGVAQAIVDKADLKQTDVRTSFLSLYHPLCSSSIIFLDNFHNVSSTDNPDSGCP
jgi:hypothetical protein